VVARWSRSTKLPTSGPVNTGMGDCVRVQFNISICNQPPRSTQPGHPFVGRRNEYQPNGGNALRLGNKCRDSTCVGSR